MSNRSQLRNKNETRRFHFHQPDSLQSLETELKTSSLNKSSTLTSPNNSLIQLRSADQSDIQFITDLSKKIFNIYGAYDEMVPDWLGLETTVTIIAQIEKLVCGFAMIGNLYNRYDFSDTSELLAIGVTPQMQGMERKDLIPSLSGNASILISEGLVKKPRVFLKVLEFMSLKNILQNFYKDRPPHLREEGLYFQSMQGDAIIDHGIAKTENFVMRSPALNAVAIGEEDLVMQTHNLELFTQPLGTLESILRKLPVVGRILVGDEKKSILTVGYKVTGSWSEPEVKPVPFESFGKGVLGTLERILLTPIRIFENIQGITNRILTDDSEVPQDQNQ